MEVAADPKVRQGYFTGTKDLARSDDGVVLRMAEVVGVTNVRANLGSEIFGRVGSVLGAGVAVEPSEIGKRERLGLWIGGVSYHGLLLRDGWRWSRGFRRCGLRNGWLWSFRRRDVMRLRLGRIGLGPLQLDQLLLNLV